MDDSTPSSIDAGVGTATPAATSAKVLSIWHRPVSYRAQCWVAWVGLTAFGARGVAAMSAGAPLDIERMIAVALSVVWGIDLLRGRSAEV
jgi:hypothetical protein